MANYPPEAEARIKELEEELAALKKSRCVISPHNKTDSLRKITHISSEYFDQRIVWLAKAASAAVDVRKRVVKNHKNMTYDQIVKASECAAELADVLLRHAIKNYGLQEVQDDG